MNSKYYLPAATAAASLYTILLGWFFPDHSFRWPMFYLWAFPVMGMILLRIIPETGEERETPKFESLLRHEKFLHYVLLALFALPFVVYLSTYPFVAIHDEIRDGALRAQEIATGKLENIFGHDWSQGLSFATLASLIYRVTGPSVLCYRILGAVSGVLSLLLMYFGFGRVIGYRGALIATLILASNQAFLFFGRTESLIEIGALISLAAFLACMRLIHARSEMLLSIAAVAGLLVGFSFGMHASTRPPVVFFTLIGIGGLWINARRGVIRWQSALAAAGLIFVFTLVGLGPQVFSSSVDFVMGAGRGRLDLTLQDVILRYGESVRVLFNQTVTMHFSNQRLLSLDISTVLPLVVIVVLWCGNLTSVISLAGILFLLVSNSAVTDQVNAGHRILPLIPLVALMVADPLARLTYSKNRTVAAAVFAIFLLLRGIEVQDFFGSYRATAHLPEEISRPFNLSLRHLFHHVQTDQRWKDKKEIVIYVRRDGAVHEELMPGHIAEAFWFFLEGKTMTVQAVEGLRATALFVSSRKMDQPPIHSWPELHFCPEAGRFACGQPAFPIFEDPDFSAPQPEPQPQAKAAAEEARSEKKPKKRKK